ncbi:MAG: serine/threonine protein kinase [Myxococcales bacterium]|nr:serine/threonine protein kinase [Myxococcales bacterium]
MKLETDHLRDLPARTDPLIGKELAGRYRITRRLGGGGMGAVYEAEHVLIGRRVAIKVLHAQFATDAEVVRRFMNEARAAGMIHHPNILECTDMGQADDGSPFLVLELLEGRDLGDLIRECGALPLGRTVRIARQVVAALSAAHERGIVHRDLKPDNIFLVADDRVKVLDFGISKFASLRTTGGPGTATGSILGTPYYMAPEQLRDASRVDARADIYALGVVLFEALSGRVPFTADTLPELILSIAMADPPPIAALRPDLPEAIVSTIERMMAKRPEDRFVTMTDVDATLAPFEHDTADAPLGFRATMPHPSMTPMVTSSAASAPRRSWPMFTIPLALGAGALTIWALTSPAPSPAASAAGEPFPAPVAALAPSPLGAERSNGSSIDDDDEPDEPVVEPTPLTAATLRDDPRSHVGAIVALEGRTRESSGGSLLFVMDTECAPCVFGLRDATPRAEALRISARVTGETRSYDTRGGARRQIPVLAVEHQEEIPSPRWSVPDVELPRLARERPRRGRSTAEPAPPPLHER